MRKLLFGFVAASNLLSSGISASEGLSPLISEYIKKERQYIKCMVAGMEPALLLLDWPAAKSGFAKKALKDNLTLLENTSCSRGLVNSLEDSMLTLKGKVAKKKQDLGLGATVYTEKDLVNDVVGRRVKDETLLTAGMKGFLPCPNKTYSASELRSRSLWHENYVLYGHTCSTRMFKKSRLALGENAKFQKLFSGLQEEKPLTKDYRKDLFKGRNIAIVPSLAYEKIYMLFLPIKGKEFAKQFKKDPNEFLTVRMVAKLFKDFGAENVKVIDRSTSIPLKDQAKLTFKSLDDFGKAVGNYDVISQSAGSQAVNYMLKNISKTKAGLPTGMSSWINVGGTPRGSAIAEFKSSFDFFFTEHMVGQLETLNQLTAPNIMALMGLAKYGSETRTGDIRRLVISAKEAVKRDNIQDLSHQNPDTMFSEDELKKGSATFEMPIVNVVAVVEDIEERTKSADPVIALQSMYGVSEGSSLLADVGIDSKKSVQLFLKGDHLGFYFNKEKDKVASLYFQIFKALMDGGFFQ